MMSLRLTEREWKELEGYDPIETEAICDGCSHIFAAEIIDDSTFRPHRCPACDQGSAMALHDSISYRDGFGWRGDSTDI